VKALVTLSLLQMEKLGTPEVLAKNALLKFFQLQS
jgi:hypothetical protein